MIRYRILLLALLLAAIFCKSTSTSSGVVGPSSAAESPSTSQQPKPVMDPAAVAQVIVSPESSQKARAADQSQTSSLPNWGIAQEVWHYLDTSIQVDGLVLLDHWSQDVPQKGIESQELPA